MRIKEFNKKCIHFLEQVQKKMKPFKGIYYVDFRFIKRVCRKHATAIFIHLKICGIASYYPYSKTLIIESTKLKEGPQIINSFFSVS